MGRHRPDARFLQRRGEALDVAQGGAVDIGGGGGAGLKVPEFLACTRRRRSRRWEMLR